MDSTELYQRLLGLQAPWRVTEVILSEGLAEVLVKVEYTSHEYRCPHCQAAGSLHACAPGRRWRHLDTCQMVTIIECSVPRILCQDHKVTQLAVPTRFSIDEKSWRGRRYATIIGDPARGIVEDMVSDHGKAALKAWFEGMDLSARQAIQYVTMDFLEAFRSAVRATVPDVDAKIVHDKFHLVKATNDALEQTRRSEMAHYRDKQEPDSVKLLMSARFALLRRGTELKDRYQEQVDMIDEWFHDTGDAYRMKESIRLIFSETCVETVKEKLEEWVAWVKDSHLEPMKKVAYLVLTRMQGILSIFRLGKFNANAENLNAHIQAVRIKSRGYRNYEAFKRNILFHLGGLELYPIFLS